MCVWLPACMYVCVFYVVDCLVGVVSVQSHSVLADHALVFCNFARGQGDEAELKHFLWVRAPFLENVLGFARADPLPHKVPVQAFLNMLELVLREDTPTTLTTRRCTSSRFPRGAWANLSRPRTLAFLHSRSQQAAAAAAAAA